MDEYIKREDALKAIDRVRCEIHKPHEKYVIGELLMGVFDSSFDACDRGVNRIPAADVAPKSEVAKAFRQRMNEKMGKHTHLLGKEYVQRIMREIEKEFTEGNPK